MGMSSLHPLGDDGTRYRHPRWRDVYFFYDGSACSDLRGARASTTRPDTASVIGGQARGSASGVNPGGPLTYYERQAEADALGRLYQPQISADRGRG